MQKKNLILSVVLFKRQRSTGRDQTKFCCILLFSTIYPAVILLQCCTFDLLFIDPEVYKTMIEI